MGLMDYFKKLRNAYVNNQVNNIEIPDFQESAIARKSIIFIGNVQNVGFRLEIFELAKRLGLTGWVKNNKDKSVVTEIQGDSEKILFLINFMKSLKRARVKKVKLRDLDILDDEKDFIIKY